MNLPYKIYGGLSFYQRAEIKNILAYYRLTANPQDEEALKRIINYPKRGIGKTSMEKIAIAADHYNKTTSDDVSLWDVIANPKMYPCEIPSGTRTKLNGFVTMMQSFMIDLEKKDAYELAQHIASSSGILRDLYSDKTPEGVSRYENIQALLSGIKEFAEGVAEEESAFLADFMMDVALLTDADSKDDDNDHITLMTIHASKGLEFKYVYVVGLEENLFPSQMALNSREELEEERRLFYVAVTRAETNCTLSYATSRYRWGNLITSEPSRFIEEIDSKYLELAKTTFNGGGRSLNQKSMERKIGGTQSGLPKRTLTKLTDTPNKVKGDTSDNLQDLKVGYNVKHERFGKGKVVGLEGSPISKATVFFPKVGNKQLLLKFAKLEILS
jgi:DNA helicase-2/ATP-dependent DNA helicase PcrA